MWLIGNGMSGRNVIEYVDSISVVYAVNICGKIVVDKMSHRDYIRKNILGKEARLCFYS